jgi:hypothetical protein
MYLYGSKLDKYDNLLIENDAPIFYYYTKPGDENTL